MVAFRSSHAMATLSAQHDLYRVYKNGRLIKDSSGLARPTGEKQQPFIEVLAGAMGLTQAVAGSAGADDVGFDPMAALVARGHNA